MSETFNTPSQNHLEAVSADSSAELDSPLLRIYKRHFVHVADSFHTNLAICYRACLTDSELSPDDRLKLIDAIKAHKSIERSFDLPEKVFTMIFPNIA